ncbi:hypothetical protein, partial [Corynebacterium diphtheriae]|uniref:hypothetical protein n=1 Tax=Corynebacterium diphtheriae TaxID=1717 RepID=UPI001C625A75
HPPGHRLCRHVWLPVVCFFGFVSSAPIGAASHASPRNATAHFPMVAAGTADHDRVGAAATR